MHDMTTSTGTGDEEFSSILQPGLTVAPEIGHHMGLGSECRMMIKSSASVLSDWIGDRPHCRAG